MSTLLWTGIAGFLYFEVALAIMLLLPFIPASFWKRLFQSAALRWVNQHSTFYVRCGMLVLVLVFVEAVRETAKYSYMHTEAEKTLPHHDVDIRKINIRMFRAQRNIYISGFAMFTFFILNRLVKLINEHARIEAQSAASMAQARSASETAKQLISASSTTKSSKPRVNTTAQAKEVLELQKAISEAEVELEAMLERSVNITQEYDKLHDEHEKLLKEMARANQ